jgi:tetratricopeptide (TPR) repeat protein
MDHTRLRHELVQLSTLILVALAVFIATRELAAYSRRLQAADASAWYQRGLAALGSGDSVTAADDFRRAAAKNRDERTYALALARALERSGNIDAAERALLALREAAPEDADVNHELAHVAAAHGNVPDAVRYYRNALYAPASAADAELRRGIRLQLIQLLLAHDDKRAALSELLVASEDTAPDAAAITQLGDLFAQAGDVRHAQEQYVRAFRSNPRTRRIADVMIAADPLADRLSSSERQRRLVSNIAAVQRRLADCVMRGAADMAVQDAAQRLDMFATQLTQPNPDAIDAGVDLIYAAEQAAERSCGEASPTDRALLLIGRLHAATP